MCRSIYRVLNAAEFAELHEAAFEDEDFIESIVAGRGGEPNTALWQEIGLHGNSVLEVGPGTGHLLAAARDAGCAVAAVETSDRHRKYIEDTWGICDVYPDFDGLGARRFDVVIAINVLEHVYDVVEFLQVVRSFMEPGGQLFISTVNATSAEATTARMWWAMFKQDDHVSFGTPTAIAAAAAAAGLVPARVWTGELPFEYLVTVLVAARDRLRSSKGAAAPGGVVAEAAPNVDARRRWLRVLYRWGARVDPTSRLLKSVNRAATVKAVLTQPAP